MSGIFVLQCKILNELIKYKSGRISPDGKSPSLLIFVFQFCLNDIVQQLNCLVSYKQFPDFSLQIAHIIPVHKKVSRKNIEIYRLISIVPARAHIFERTLNNKKTVSFKEKCVKPNMDLKNIIRL